MTENMLLYVCETLGQAPEWIKVLPLGTVELRDNRPPFEVDRAALDAILSKFRLDGLDLVVDYEHQSLGGGKAPAAAWIKELEIREDGLYARVEWTEAARRHVEAGEYRYYSPVLKLEPETRRPLALMHAALTNTPAMANLPPLLAAKYGEGIIVLEDITAETAGRVARSQQYAIGIKSGGHQRLCGEMAVIPEEHWGDPVNWRFPIPDAAIKALRVMEEWDNPGTQEEYTPAERAIIDKRIKSRAKAVGMQIQEAKPMKAELMKLLGIAGEKPDEEILALADIRLKIGAALPEIAQALGLKAEATVSEITGTVLALKQGAEHLTTLQGEVAALKAESAKAKASAAVDGALKAGKLQPSQTEWAMEYAGRDLEGFKVFVEKAPKTVPVGEAYKMAKEPGAGPDGLTPDELAVCKQLNLTPEAFKAQRQAMQEG